MSMMEAVCPTGYDCTFTPVHQGTDWTTLGIAGISFLAFLLVVAIIAWTIAHDGY